MTTELDIYGMTPEERKAFEQWVFSQDDDQSTDILRECWAARAKLCREQLHSLQVLLNYEYTQRSPDLVARIATLEATRRDQTARIKELEAEVERLRADAAELTRELEQRRAVMRRGMPLSPAGSVTGGGENAQ